MVEVRRRYKILMDNIPDKYAVLRRPVIIVGHHRDKGIDLGVNVNKGYEIHLCLGNNDPNMVFHVLLHELAHSTVPELDHSPQFWKNMEDLVNLAVSLGIYTRLTKSAFCGNTITD
jgi:predicted metal-dependent hydrolase